MPVFVFGCMSCGKTVSGREKSCPRCGASFEGVVFECPFCGDPVSPADTKCSGCGTEFNAFAEDVSDTAQVELDGVASQSTASRTDAGSESVEYECPSCGRPVGENDEVCPHCGARFS